SKSETGGGDSFFDGMDHRFVPHLHGNEPGFGHAHGGDLIERHVGAVSLDLHRLEQARRGAAGTQPAQLLLQQLDCTLHAAPELVDVMRRVCPGDPSTKLVDPPSWRFRVTRWATAPQVPTTVARPVPRSTAAIASFSRIENTMIGIRFSRASAKAVVSITFRLRSIASWWLKRSYRLAFWSFFGSAL